VKKTTQAVQVSRKLLKSLLGKIDGKGAAQICASPVGVPSSASTCAKSTGGASQVSATASVAGTDPAPHRCPEANRHIEATASALVGDYDPREIEHRVSPELIKMRAAAIRASWTQQQAIDRRGPVATVTSQVPTTCGSIKSNPSAPTPT